MSEAKEVGKTLSILVILFLYCCMLGWCMDKWKICNRNAKWETAIARIIVYIHIFALLVFCAWGWIK